MQREPLPVPEAELRRDRLLLPPLITNLKPWTMGFFQRVARPGLKKGDVFERHCFHRGGTAYVDEFFKPVKRRFSPCGESGLWSIKYIDDKVYDALLALGVRPKSRPVVDRVEDDGKEGPGLFEVTLRLPPTDSESAADWWGLEDRLSAAVAKAKAGELEGHGTDLRTGVVDIRFYGPNVEKLVKAIRPVLKRSAAKLPIGWSVAARRVDDVREARVEMDF